MKTSGCSIVSEFSRPPRELVESFRNIPVANIDDAMNRLAAVNALIRPFNNKPLLGTAFTVKVSEGDNLMFHKAMDMAQAGDVIVIDARGDVSRAIFGELMISYCVERKIAGVIVDGAVRDAEALAEMDIAIYARGVSPNGPYKNGPGEINMPISFGGQVVRPGDIILGDNDGIIVVRPEEGETILAMTREIEAKEADIMARIKDEKSYIRPWVDEKLKELKCDYR
ncbi:RraA family protein [Erwinia billingiae]|uniref:RraA family protein n=1 Tax=Erwinia billingiae TaxID=182337 RepID=UPI00320B3F0E